MHKLKRQPVENELSHLAYGEAWKDFDRKIGWFAEDTRNIRLGLATDDFNPFGNMNNSYSMCQYLYRLVYYLCPFSFSVETSIRNLGLSLWMGEPLVDFSTEGVSRRSCLCHSTHETAGCEHSCVCCKDEGFEAEIACGQDDFVVEKIGTALAKVMHVYDDDGPDLGEDSEDDDPLLSLESVSTDDLGVVDNEVVISPAFPSDDASESSIGKSDDGNSSTNGIPTLVSAIKGTRAKQGIVTKLSVSWAPDVYDPPVTSDTHTVRGYQRSSRKGHYKYKPSKSSSSCSTSGSKKDKKHPRHSSSSSNNKKDKKHSYRSSSSSTSSRTDPSFPQYRKAYSASSSSIRTDTRVLEPAKVVSPLLQAESAALPEAVPILKTMEQIKCSTSCKEKPFNLLSRQFSPARYKGMFSFWSQNQLA